MSVRAVLQERDPRRIRLNGAEVKVRVRASQRARTARLLVGARRPPEVIVPASTPESTVDELLEAKRGWLERKLRELERRASQRTSLGLDRPGFAWIDGEPLRIELVEGPRSLARLRGPIIAVSGDPAGASGAVERLLRREARRRIGATAEREAARLGLRFTSLSVRDQRTRWGSCSAAGRLSFSWRLILAPAAVRESIVVHELCHLEIPNHTRAFWRRLSLARPSWREEARWLERHGDELAAYRVRMLDDDPLPAGAPTRPPVLAHSHGPDRPA